MTSGLAEIRKTIELDAPLARAFEVWTEQVGRWWPLAEHSISKADATGCFIEPGVGGRLYETTRSGDEHQWGTVVVWEPPRRVAYSWHPQVELSDRTMILVMFTPLTPNRTRLSLTHSGWQPGQEERRVRYHTGWDGLLRNGYVAYLAGALNGS
ncbi:MAG: SRPBCC domain-containing protein [Geminicoccaceae bacterium]